MQSIKVKSITEEHKNLIKKIKFDEATNAIIVISEDKITINNESAFFEFLSDYIEDNCLDPNKNYRCNMFGMQLYKLYDYLYYD